MVRVTFAVCQTFLWRGVAGGAGTLRAVIRQVRLLDRADVRAALDMASCIDACEEAFAAYAGGNAELPGVIHLNVPESGGEVHVKAGHLHGSPYYAVKAASGFYESDPPSIDGMVTIFDARDGAVAAVLLDGGLLTDLRTGAAGGVAARHLAPQRVETVAVIGTGEQARYQLDALALVRPGFSRVQVWGRSGEHAQRCVSDLRGRVGLPVGCVFEVAGSVGEAVDAAQLVITCTASTVPLVSLGMLARGAHITAVGSDGVGKQELDPDVLARADLLVVDSLDQCLRLGELQHAAGEASRAIELGEICAGGRDGRADEHQLTVCDLTGVGVQDVAAANVVMQRAGEMGVVVEL
jgi:ornithine cyclodeaminase/alanine dehydrogenase-like protein (mu-crystallin family)